MPYWEKFTRNVGSLITILRPILWFDGVRWDDTRVRYGLMLEAHPDNPGWEGPRGQKEDARTYTTVPYNRPRTPGDGLYHTSDCRKRVYLSVLLEGRVVHLQAGLPDIRVGTIDMEKATKMVIR
jgi:hypothetical protein